MIVGTVVVELHVEGSQSLKAKRGVIRSISRRLRNRFNVSVAEVGGQGTWQRAALGIAAAGSNALRVEQHLKQAVEFLDDMHLAQITATTFEPFETGYAESPGDPEPDYDLPASWSEDDDVTTN